MRKKNIVEVQRLRELGWKHRQIAAKTGLSMRTICRMLKVDVKQVHVSPRGAKSSLDKYQKFIIEQLEHGKINYTKIYKMLKSKGYNGNYSTVRFYIIKTFPQFTKIPLSQEEIHATDYISNDDILQGIWRGKKFSDEEKLSLKKKWNMFAYCCEKIIQFRELFKTRNKEKLNEFIEESESDKKNIFYTFASGLRKDLDAVMNSLSYSYNNGLLEGHVNRLKVIKRIMYGRAGYDLLRKKVLYLEKLT